MKQVFVQAGIATFLSIIVSLGICWAALTAVGSGMDAFAAAMCVICPLVIAFPASAYTYNQKRKIALSHEALTAAHRELAAMHEKLAEKARRDDLTGLLNRTAFIGAVNGTRGNEERGALLLVDADNFKQINDTFGHLTGDRALCEIAGAIREAAGEAHPTGRLGGEEFGIFLNGAGLKEALEMAERVRAAVEAVRFRPAGQEAVQLTVSVGGALAKSDDDFSALMNEADRRLYEAKRRGRNRVVTDPPGSVAA